MQNLYSSSTEPQPCAFRPERGLLLRGSVAGYGECCAGLCQLVVDLIVALLSSETHISKSQLRSGVCVCVCVCLSLSVAAVVSTGASFGGSVGSVRFLQFQHWPVLAAHPAPPLLSFNIGLCL